MPRPHPGRAGLAPALALLCLVGVGARAQEAPSPAAGPLFEPLELRVPGRVLEVVPARLGLVPGGRGRDLLVVAVEGTPPDEKRRILAFAGDAQGRPGPSPAWRMDVPPEVVGYDVGRIESGPGPEALVLLSADALRWVRPGAPDGTGAGTRALTPGAPLPGPTRGLARLTLLGDWEGDGRPAALVPALGGARVVPIEAGGAERLVALPLQAEYQARGPGPPARDEWLEAEITWPVIERGDDDGDGRPDLFALSRFRAEVHRTGGGGIATLPSRSLRLHPFTSAEELRHRATSLRMRALDLDGDGRADLFVHRNAGTLLKSRALTEIFWNRGADVPFGPDADVKREEEGALVTCDPADLDGDGKSELVETRVAFGIVQIARVLATRHIEVDARIVALSREAAPRVTWTGSLSLGLDFGQGRVIGLLPTVDGDWNGDGRKDVLYGAGAGAIEVRLGVAAAEGPGFGPVAGAQEVPAEGLAVVADVDGDGLDDLVVYDPMDARGIVRVLRNLGTLPGTPPSVRRTGAPAAPAP